MAAAELATRIEAFVGRAAPWGNSLSIRERYLSITRSEVGEMVGRGEPETLHLDFKLANRDDLGHKDDRKNLARALSGFANSDGGIILWGVDARAGGDGIDCAIAEVPLHDPRMFLSRLNALTSDAVAPVVDGVEHRIVESENGRGFVATLVPPSESGPHMAKLGEDRYYKRSGTSFIKLEHYDLEDMFGRRPRPVLSGTLSCRFEGEMPNHEGQSWWRWAVVVGIHNSGRGMARAPYIAIETNKTSVFANTYGLSGGGADGLPRLISSAEPGWIACGGTAGHVIHPGTRLDVTKLLIQFFGRPPVPQDVRVRYRIAAEGVRLAESGWNLTAADFKQLMVDSR